MLHVYMLKWLDPLIYLAHARNHDVHTLGIFLNALCGCYGYGYQVISIFPRITNTSSLCVDTAANKIG